MMALVLRACKKVKAQVCQGSPLQVKEMRADKGYITTSKQGRKEIAKTTRGRRGRERRVGIKRELR